MNRRTKTAADYAAIAVAPVLIFIMISSLVNFLTLVVYRGNFPERIQWTFLMVTMGSVAAARLSIEQDRGKSLGYLFALAAAAFFVLTRFAANPLFSIVLLGLIGWLSDVIVRDCTLIDDSKDSSDQGLIQSAGRCGHRPGRTVLYLAVAALPLFGIGQYFLRSYGNVWVGAQKLLALYLFAALSLLVTTSFLGLRRYLRQRGAEMPTNVTVAWLAGGLAMVIGILLVAMLAPLPGQAIASMEVPDFASATEGPQASKYGWGNEGTSKDAKGANRIQKPQDTKSPTGSAQKGAPPGQADSGNSKTGPAGNQSGGKKTSPQSDSSKQSSSPPSTDSSGQKGPPNKPGDQGPKKESAGQSKTSDPEAKSGEAKDGPKPGQSGKSPESPQQSQGSQPKPSDSEKAIPSSEGKPKPSPSGKPDSENPQPNQSQSEKPQSAPPETKPLDSNPLEAKEPLKDSAESKPNESESSNDQPMPKEDSSDQPPKSDDPGSKEGQEEKPSEQQDDANKSKADPSESEQSESEQSKAEQSESEQSQEDQSESEQSESEPETPEPESSGPSAFTTLLSAIANLIKPLILLACIAVVGYFLWTQWSAIQQWWQNLFHREGSSQNVTNGSTEVTQSAIPPRPFHSFTNPFQNASDPRQALLTTFAALEAFAREQGVARKNDETPSEFLQRMRSRLPDLAAGSAMVVDAYNRLLYGGIQRPTAGDLRAAEALWQKMK
jgi:Domain of unknown function (DUF4129)